MAPAISAQQLAVTFARRGRQAAVHALQPLDLTLEPGRILGVLGPNGSGKTTLLDVPQFLRQAAQGDVRKAIDDRGGPGELRNVRAASDALISLGVGLAELSWQLQLSPKGASQNPLYREIARAGEDSILDQSASEPRTLLRLISDHPDGVALQPLLRLLDSYRVYRAYALDRLRRSGSQSSSDAFLYPDGANLFSLLRNWRDRPEDRERYDFVLSGLRAAFPGSFADLGFEFAGQTVSGLIIGPGGERLSTFGAADGWLTALLHLCAVASAERGGLLSIDEPENGLHPFAIREVLAAMRAWCEPRAITAVLATHSPVVLDQFKEEPSRVLVMEPGEESVPVALDQIHDPDWLAQFSLGYLYAHERFGQQGGSGGE